MVPDFYAMLGVEPEADRAAIEAALCRAQPVWSSGTRNPKTKHTHQSYLDQIPALRQALLGDPLSRSAYDAELTAQRQSERDRRLDALQKRVKLRAAKGGLTVGDRTMLREEAARLGLTASELDRLAGSFPPKPEAPADDDSPDEPLDVLDAVMRRQIRLALDHLRKADLYDALGLARDAPTAEVTDRAEAERRRWMKKTQVTAEKTAWLEVVTLAQSHLTLDASRARYDRTLALEAELEFGETVAFAMRGLTRLDAGTHAALLDEAAAAGVAAARGERLINRACRALGVGREGAAPAAPPSKPARVLRCRECGGLTEYAGRPKGKNPAAAVCRHCGASLQWACPACKRSHLVDEPKCACGFKRASREPFVRHFEAAQGAFRNRDYGSALAHLRRAQDFAPHHVGARKGVEKVRERLEEVEHARALWEVARANRRLVAAREAAAAWGRLVDRDSPDWRAAWEDVLRGIREATIVAAKARSRERADPAGARELYRLALTQAADLPEAIAGLKRCPPEPSFGLTAEFVGDRVRLRWSPPTPDGLGPVSFVILRKAETALKHPADGVRIGESLSPEFEDPGVSPGTSVAYAVLTKRGDVESVGAVAVGPIFLLGEVRSLRVDTRTREVDLSWTPPGGAVDVRVVRKRGGAPAGPLDGDRVESLIDQAHDRGLDHDKVYHYGIFAVYRTPDGRSTASPGVFLSVQPHTTVPALAAPTVTIEPDRRVGLHWVEPPRGLVKILRTARPLPYVPGTRLPPAETVALAGDWVEIDASDQAHDDPPAASVVYYTPMTSWGGSVTVGHAAVHSTLADPTDLRATRVGGGRVHLRWQGGAHGGRTLVLYRPGAPPDGPDDSAATAETLPEEAPGRRGHHTITLPAGVSGPWHVAVLAVASVDGVDVTSPGLEPSCRTVVSGPSPEVTVAYHFRRSRLTGRRWSVTLRTEPAGSSVPPTVLVLNSRAVPFSHDDGEVIARFPAARDGATFPIPPGLNLSRQRARLFADPEAEPDGLPPILLRHPEADATRV